MLQREGHWFHEHFGKSIHFILRMCGIRSKTNVRDKVRIGNDTQTAFVPAGIHPLYIPGVHDPRMNNIKRLF